MLPEVSARCPQAPRGEADWAFGGAVGVGAGGDSALRSRRLAPARPRQDGLGGGADTVYSEGDGRFQGRAEGMGHWLGMQAAHRGIQQVEAVLHDSGRDLASQPAHGEGFVHNQQVVGLVQTPDKGVHRPGERWCAGR